MFYFQSDAPSTPSGKKNKSKRFTGKEVCDWIMAKEVLKITERSDAMRLGQRLVDNHHLKEADTSHVYFQDADDATYIFSREAISSMSLHASSKKA